MVAWSRERLGAVDVGGIARKAGGGGLAAGRAVAAATRTLYRAAADGELLASRGGRAYYIGLAVVVLALVSGLSTYLILTGLTGIRPTHGIVLYVLLVNVLLVIGLLAVVGWQIWRLFLARRQSLAGARLHVRIVALFSLIAVMPAITLAVFASSSLNRALDRLFSKGTLEIVENASGVARAYVNEHGQVIRSDIVAMASDVEGLSDLYKSKRNDFENALFAQASLRNLPMARIIDGAGKDLAVAPLPNALIYIAPPRKFLTAAATGDVVVVPPDQHNQVGALKKLTSIPGAYLYVSRAVDGHVLDQLRATEESVSYFQELARRRQATQMALGSMYALVALTLLLSAVWMGMWLANRLVSPIRRLITAAQEVARGQLDVRVPVRKEEGDLGHLSTIFNHMTGELSKQRQELVRANSQLDARRRFIEATLSGISAGVLGLDHDGVVTLANRSATKLLGLPETALLGQHLAVALPEFGPALADAEAETRRERTNGEATRAVEGRERAFALQVTRERSGEIDYGFVLTFDDITDLVSAQRSSAWADVARRIAHEIKNPLTPIQLSAERLKRKYGSVIKEDRETFDRCTDTIIRQVGDLGRMVDEFSQFARMPKPVFEKTDVNEVVKEAVFLFQVSRPEISFTVSLPEPALVAHVDRRGLAQALTNLVKNATEAIAAVGEQEPKADGYCGTVHVGLESDADTLTISIVDNGCGLPKKDRNRLTEPYVTTRTKGTGIGLAVVLKVIEQHGGSLRLDDAPGTEHGAAVKVILPRRKPLQQSDFAAEQVREAAATRRAASLAIGTTT